MWFLGFITGGQLKSIHRISQSRSALMGIIRANVIAFVLMGPSIIEVNEVESRLQEFIRLSIHCLPDGAPNSVFNLEQYYGRDIATTITQYPLNRLT